jgi:hypothetical protein
MVPWLRVRIPPPKHGGAEVTTTPKVAAKPKPPVDDGLDDIDAPPAQSQTTDADELDDAIPF